MGTRERMLDAAAEVIRARGLARATTKEIAKASGFSEAALYKHFQDKTDLFLGVLKERTPGEMQPQLDELPGRVGQGTVREHLEVVADAALRFYAATFPMAASLFAEPALLEAHKRALRQRQTGPQHVHTALADYLAAERRAGRIRPDVDPDAAALLLLGSCLMHAFHGQFTDESATPGLAATLVTTVLDGIGD